VPKPNPGKSGDDKNEHDENENIFSDPSKPSNEAHAYGHGAVNPGRIDQVFAGYGSRYEVRGTRLKAILLLSTAHSVPLTAHR